MNRVGYRVMVLCVVALASWVAFAQESIPETARGPAIDQEKGYLVEEIRDGLYWVTDGSYITMFLTTGEGVIVVDAPPSLGEKFLQAIQEVSEEEVTHLIYSHAHGDHIGAAGIFPEDVTIIAHEETAAILARREDNELRPQPDITFSDNYTLEVGNQLLELSYFGPNHQDGNIFIYAPLQRVLMLVDVIFPGWAPFKHLAISEDIPGFIDAHFQALNFNFDTFLGGHLTRPGTREDIETQRDYILDIQANALEALQTVDFMAIGQEVGFENQWLLFDTYLDAVAQACTDATLAEWEGRLGGAEVFTFSHCWTMMEALRIEWNFVGGAEINTSDTPR